MPKQQSMLPQFEAPSVAKLRFLVQQQKLNVTRVAADLGVSEITVRAWFRTGKGPKNPVLREKLAEILAKAEAA